MSPEQAKAKAVDARADVWAFGACLYEALAGKKVFDGETTTDIIAALVKLEPDWSALPAATPANVRAVLKRCLRKDPSQRIHSIADARIELEESEAPAIPPSRHHGSLAFAGGAVLAALATGLLLRDGSDPRPSGPKRVIINLPESDEVMFGDNMPSTSPDGRYIAYAGSREGRPLQLFLRPLDRFEANALEGTEGFQSGPFFSPDSQWLAFVVSGTLKKVPVEGGIPVTLADAPNFLSGSWGRDGSIVLSNLKEVRRFESSGGASEVLLKAENGEEIGWPMLLPGGTAILYTSVGPAAPAAVAVARLDSGERRILVEGGLSPSYVETGHVVFEREGTLLAAPLDLERLELSGPPVLVGEGILSRQGWLRGQFSVSDEGTLLYAPATAVSSGLAEIVWVDRRGGVEPVTELRRAYLPSSRLSPDGRRLAVALYPESRSASEIWILDIGRGALTRFSVDTGFSSRPLWTPDGETLLFGTGGSIASKRADGSGGAERFAAEPHRMPSWVTSDGKAVVFRENSESLDIGLLPLDEKSEAVLLLDSSFNEHSGVLSPDDRWLAYVSDESGQEEIYVRAFPGLEGRVLVSTDGGSEPLFFPGREGALLPQRRPHDGGSHSFDGRQIRSLEARGPVRRTLPVGNDGRESRAQLRRRRRRPIRHDPGGREPRGDVAPRRSRLVRGSEAPRSPSLAAMSFNAGDRLGQYEIAGRIGAGEWESCTAPGIGSSGGRRRSRPLPEEFSNDPERWRASSAKRSSSPP
jgi:serine/threonine-protein kinase